MPGSASKASRARVADALLFLARGALGVILAGGALLLLLHGRAFFSRLHRPDEARIALAGAEIAGACLFVFPRTVPVGGLLLLGVLAWAAGFHFAIAQPTGMLWLGLAAVLALLAATRVRRAGMGA